MKNKLTPDNIAMILADAQHGEWTTCEGVSCKKCPLSLEVDLEGVKFKDGAKYTICDLMTKSAERLTQLV